jgi:hypothetical protein
MLKKDSFYRIGFYIYAFLSNFDEIPLRHRHINIFSRYGGGVGKRGSNLRFFDKIRNPDMWGS